MAARPRGHQVAPPLALSEDAKDRFYRRNFEEMMRLNAFAGTA